METDGENMQSRLIIILALLLTSTGLFAADKQLIGVWDSKGTTSFSAGRAEFKDDGSMSLMPIGFDPAIGKWSDNNGWLDMDLTKSNKGKASARYEISDNGRKLTLYYVSGQAQEFTKKIKK